MIINKAIQSNDKKLEDAISENSVRLINVATEQIINKDFESSEKTLKALDQIMKRRRF